MNVHASQSIANAGRVIRVTAILCISSKALAQTVSRSLQSTFERDDDIQTTTVNCDFSAPEELEQHVAAAAANVDALLVISDQFGPVHKVASDGDLTRHLREICFPHEAILYLLGLTQEEVEHLRLVDDAVVASAPPAVVARAIHRAFAAIRYKRPPPSRRLEAPAVVEVAPITTIEQFVSCLKLRGKVYGSLGYMDRDIDSVVGEPELEFYDPSSLQFFAKLSTTDSIIGTARLIVPGLMNRRIRPLPNAPGFPREYSRFSRQLAESSPQLAKRIETSPQAAPLPILSAFDQRDLLPEGHLNSEVIGELSRVVVGEIFRGYGVSHLLVRACIAAGYELGLRCILLECIPQHAKFYRKFGFEKIQGMGPRVAYGIDQVVIVMRLTLDVQEGEKATQLAKRDIAMMRAARAERASPGLCLCDNEPCWRSAKYSLFGDDLCPLKKDFAR